MPCPKRYATTTFAVRVPAPVLEQVRAVRVPEQARALAQGLEPAQVPEAQERAQALALEPELAREQGLALELEWEQEPAALEPGLAGSERALAVLVPVPVLAQEPERAQVLVPARASAPVLGAGAP